MRPFFVVLLFTLSAFAASAQNTQAEGEQCLVVAVDEEIAFIEGQVNLGDLTRKELKKLLVDVEIEQAKRHPH